MVLVGIAGILVPVLPGLLLVWAGILVWAVGTGGTKAWVTLAAVSVVCLTGSVVKYLLPGRRLRKSGVPWTTLGLGGLLGVVGFFVVPVVGLVLGFVLGIYVAERLRLRTHALAWPSTRNSLYAVGWSILIELATALLAAGLWIFAVIS